MSGLKKLIISAIEKPARDNSYVEKISANLASILVHISPIITGLSFGKLFHNGAFPFIN